ALHDPQPQHDPTEPLQSHPIAPSHQRRFTPIDRPTDDLNRVNPPPRIPKQKVQTSSKAKNQYSGHGEFAGE
ncbi:MAG: hypothetical protein ACO4AJ_07345, partial [Prochlorothrix sp.]